LVSLLTRIAIGLDLHVEDAPGNIGTPCDFPVGRDVRIGDLAAGASVAMMRQIILGRLQ
jgi:hypothetical protein